MTSPPIDVVEGTLVLHIRCKTSSMASGLSISLRQDSNLDGKYCTRADGYCGSVFGAGYGDIMDLDTTVRYRKFFYGGRIKLFVDGPSKGQWSVVVSQEPAPRHRIAGRVRGASSQVAFLGGAHVVATDTEGRTYATETDGEGGYSLPLFGFSDHEITVSREGYAKATAHVSKRAFRELTFPGWAVPLDVLLDQAPARPRIECLVRDRTTKKPLEATVVMRPSSGGQPRTAQTDARGLALFRDLSEGPYTLRASASGYGEASAGAEVARGEALTRVVVDLVRLTGCNLKVTIRPAAARLAMEETLAATVRVENLGPELADVVLHIGCDTERITPVVPHAGPEWDLSDPDDLVGSLGALAPGRAIEVPLRLRPKKRGLATWSASAVGLARGVATDYDLENNQAAGKVEFQDLRIAGSVTVSDPRPGRVTPIPLPYAAVSIVPENGASRVKTFTDGSGRYAVVCKKPMGTYRIQVQLRDQKGISAIHARRGFGGKVVTLRSRAYPVHGDEARRDFEVWASSNRELDRTFTIKKTEALYDAAVYYVFQMAAVQYAKNTLGVTLDHDLPVDVFLDGSGRSVSYSSSDSHIDVSAPDSGAWSTDAPMNREYHEFGHHVNTDSELGGEDEMPDGDSDDKNHGGVENADSTDSMMEGFAEFFSLLVKGTSLYRWAGGVTNLERNFHTRSRKHGMPSEEFNVAALLWDLVDEKADAGDIPGERRFKDHFSLGAAGAWALLDSEDIENVTSLYEELSTTLGEQDSDAKDGVSDLDALFIMHGFFHDENDNGIWDADEDVGCGISWRKKGAARGHAPRRDDVPPIPGTALDMHVSDERHERIDVHLFRVEVRFPGGADDFNYEVWPHPVDGHVRVDVPADALDVVVRPVAAGYDGGALTLVPDAFWTDVERAQARGDDVAAHPRMVMKRNDVPPPMAVHADVMGPTSIRLGWRATSPVVVVRSLRHVPTLLGDGDVIYEGTGSEVTDAGLFPGAAYHYAVFARMQGRVSRGAPVEVAPGALDAGVSSRGFPTLIWIGAVVLLLLLLAILLMRSSRH